MPYTAEISRSHPAYFIFLVDQSGSMSDPQGGNPSKSKAESVSDAINRIVQNLVIQCSKNEGVFDYFCVSVIGYGKAVESGFRGALAGRPFASTSELEANPARLETRMQRIPDGAGGLVDVPVKLSVWFDPVASGPTPMCQALDAAYQLAAGWLQRNPAGYPPIVMNLTDGEATDGDPRIGAARLTSLASSDGNLLLFNVHISTQQGHTALFPANDYALVDDFAKSLFAMSSPLPDSMLKHASTMELPVQPGSRGFIFNADIVSVIQFLEIGTRPSNMSALALR
ncbi:MAG: VWA domain-containing protein [bacterium]|nr:VWA domain-containing protein [bacterium]